MGDRRQYAIGDIFDSAERQPADQVGQPVHVGPQGFGIRETLPTIRRPDAPNLAELERCPAPFVLGDERSSDETTAAVAQQVQRRQWPLGIELTKASEQFTGVVRDRPGQARMVVAHDPIAIRGAEARQPTTAQPGESRTSPRGHTVEQQQRGLLAEIVAASDDILVVVGQMCGERVVAHQALGTVPSFPRRG